MIVNQHKMSQEMPKTERNMSRDLAESYRKELDLVLQLKRAEMERSKRKLINETEEMRQTLMQVDETERRQRQHLKSRELNLLRESQSNAESKKKEELQQRQYDVEDIKKNLARNEELELLAEKEARNKRQMELEALKRHLNESSQIKDKAREEQRVKEIEYRKGEGEFLKKLEKEGKETTEKVREALKRSVQFGQLYQKVYNAENEKKKQMEFLMIDKPYQEKLNQEKEQELRESIHKREKREETNNILRSQIEDNKLRKDSEFLSNLRSENEHLYKEMAKWEAQDVETRANSKHAMKEYLDSIQSQIMERRNNRQVADAMNVHESKVNEPLMEETQQKLSSSENPVAFPGYQIQHDRIKQLQMIDKSLKLEESFLQTLDPANENGRFQRSSFSRRSLAAKLDTLKPKCFGLEKENGSPQTVNFKSDYEFIRHKDKAKNYDIISHMFRNN